MPLSFLIGLLYLLLLGGAEGSFFSPDKWNEESYNLISMSYEYEEYVQSLPTVTLAPRGKTQKVRLYSSIQDYGITNLKETAYTDNYLKLSIQVTPGLDIQDIIFPFHFFL